MKSAGPLILLLMLGTTVALPSFSAAASSSSFGSIQGLPGTQAGAAPILTTNGPVSKVCSFGVHVGPTGIYAIGTGVYVEDWDTGNLMWCGKDGSQFIVESPPLDGGGLGYTGMAGVNTGLGLVLVLVSWSADAGPGLWFCFGATPVQSSGCAFQSAFILLPSSFCATLKTGTCSPGGIALDSALNVYYTDFANAVVVKCSLLSANQHCAVIETLSRKPFGLYRNPATGDLWVSDDSCTGYVWKNGVVQYTLNDELEGITISSANPTKTPHVYVADTEFCSLTAPAHIQDLTDGKSLHTPLTGAEEILGITTGLQFTAFDTGDVWSVRDRS